MSLTLIIGDKTLSSWSLRAWLALRASGLKFNEKKILLDGKESAANLKRYSPSARVPALVVGKAKKSLTLWDSLAIAEYVNELAPEAQLLPRELDSRALARSYIAEMHSGFQSLRSQMPMDLSTHIKIKHLLPSTVADIKRITHLWDNALRMSGGPYLFGHNFGLVDAFYAPVVTRLDTYGVAIKNPRCRRYAKRIMSHKFMREWIAGAVKEKPVRYTR